MHTGLAARDPETKKLAEPGEMGRRPMERPVLFAISPRKVQAQELWDPLAV